MKLINSFTNQLGGRNGRNLFRDTHSAQTSFRLIAIMKKFHDLTLFRLICKLLFIARIFGYVPFAYPTKKFKFSIFGVCLSMMNILACLKGFYDASQSIKYLIIAKDVDRSLKIAGITISLTISSAVLCIACVVTVNFFQSKKIVKFLNQMEKLDRKVRDKLIFFGVETPILAYFCMSNFRIY